MQPIDHILGRNDLEGHNSLRAETVDMSNMHQGGQMRDGYRRRAYERRERTAQEMTHTSESALGNGNRITIYHLSHFYTQ